MSYFTAMSQKPFVSSCGSTLLIDNLNKQWRFLKHLRKLWKPYATDKVDIFRREGSQFCLFSLFADVQSEVKEDIKRIKELLQLKKFGKNKEARAEVLETLKNLYTKAGMCGGRSISLIFHALLNQQKC